MARRELRLEERHGIVALHDNNVSIKQIAEHHLVHKTTVQRIIKRHKSTSSTDTLFRSERPAKNNDRVKWSLIRKIKTRRASTLNELTVVLNDLEIGTFIESTVRRFVH